MNERKSSKWWEMDFQVHVNLRMRREALRDDTPGTKIQETMVLILIYPEAWLSYSGEPYLLAACWQGRNFSAAHTSRSCKDRKELCTYFDEGLPNGQSRVIIEPSDPQNDGEIAEEANQEDDERLIYPSTLEDESDGKSDAEGIDTTRASRKPIQEAPGRLELLWQLPTASLTSAQHPMPLARERANQFSNELWIRILQPRKWVYTPRRQLRMQRILCTFLPHHLLLPLNFVIHSTRPHRAPFQDNDNQTEMFRHYISTSGELHRVHLTLISDISAHNMTFHMSMDYVALTVRNQCQDCCAHMSMDYVGLSLLGNQWWSELEVSL
ncbi:hypothetical protein BJ912DRAFT_927131 [Pholiota molesta]|nr:hypothetical protein BJ912DRAFT_927131 [Pholiota molesta]